MRINSKNRGFVEGTLVLMADGKQKPIEQIQTGDYVLSFNEFDADAPLEAMQVTNTFSRIDNNILEIKSGETVLKVAKDQMFIGPHSDWKEVYSHSLVVDVDGNPIEYTVNKVKKGKHKVYDITVDENHSLIANGIRVHNAISSGTASGSGAKSGSRGSGSGLGSPQSKSAASDKGFGGVPGTANRSGGALASKGVKASQTKGGGGPQNPGNAGQTSKQSANNSMGSRNDSGAGRRGGGGGGIGSIGPVGSIGGVSRNTISTVAGGRKKKSLRAIQNDEPSPVKPSGVAVGIKLIETIENTVDVLQELISSLTPTQLTSAKISIQAGADSIYSFANEYVAAIYAAEMQVYDKTYLIQVASNIMTNAAELRNPFEETVVSAQGKNIALLHLSVIEAEVSRITGKLNVYTVNDGRGELEVTVNNIPNSRISYSNTVRRNKYGKWTTKAV